MVHGWWRGERGFRSTPSSLHELKQLQRLGTSLGNNIVLVFVVVIVVVTGLKQLDSFGHGHTSKNSLHLSVGHLLAALLLMLLVLLHGLIGSYDVQLMSNIVVSKDNSQKEMKKTDIEH